MLFLVLSSQAFLLLRRSSPHYSLYFLPHHKLPTVSRIMTPASSPAHQVQFALSWDHQTFSPSTYSPPSGASINPFTPKTLFQRPSSLYSLDQINRFPCHLNQYDICSYEAEAGAQRLRQDKCALAPPTILTSIPNPIFLSDNDNYTKTRSTACVAYKPAIPSDVYVYCVKMTRILINHRDTPVENESGRVGVTNNNALKTVLRRPH
jgi:hypothetical protein